DARRGVDVATNGANSIYVYLEDGARVDVSGAEAQGVKVKGRSDLSVDSGANISVRDTSVAANGKVTAAIIAEILDATATSNVVLNQRAGSRLTGSGLETQGMAVNHSGRGSVLIRTAGDIEINGSHSFGIT